ncbi:hypothetical protein-signal peptide prediction [Rhodopirellula baltica SH 1]|uniref:Secreted protein n=1 Tax=Rhodopirellula baltica (strain DSM 10527 / NCIMB 13988 / SH1) TaxID=243090 RepID=Q7UH25_RHOBA|nr:hypothetical protein-signal peptide prediction [Rhodopirellula baltica SH 1]
MFLKAFSMASLKTTAFAFPSFVTELQAQHEPVNDFPCKRFRSDEQSGNHCTSQCASTHSLSAYSSTHFLCVVPPTKKSWLTETRCSPNDNCHAAGTQLNSPFLLNGAIHLKFHLPKRRSGRCLLYRQSIADGAAPVVMHFRHSTFSRV